MRVKVQDSSGAGWVNVFHDQAVQLLGMEAEARVVFPNPKSGGTLFYL